MRNLVPTALDNYQSFKDIVNSKKAGDRKSRLNVLAPTVENYYNSYCDNRLELSNMAILLHSDEAKEDLLDCYNGTTNALKALKAYIKKAQPAAIRTTCQYCGIGPTSTFDHYLPKEVFPEFSVMPLNLLPCCSQCNTYKGTTFAVSGKRQIINLYFDPLPTKRYLNVDIAYSAGIPFSTFRLQHNLGVDEQVFNRIEAHFKHLKLCQRFRESSVEIISEGARSLARTHCGELTFENVERTLFAESNRLQKLYSPNYWVSVLFEGLASESQFVNSCIEP